MSKPEDIPPEAWDYAAAVVHVYCGCAPGRPRTNGTTHHDSCWKQVEDQARAILAAEKRGEEREREACAAIAEDGFWGVESTSPGALTSKGVWRGLDAQGIASAIRARSTP